MLCSNCMGAPVEILGAAIPITLLGAEDTLPTYGEEEASEQGRTWLTYGAIGIGVLAVGALAYAVLRRGRRSK